MKPLPSKEILDELLHADFETGKLYWKERDQKWFKSLKFADFWNNKSSNKEAFCAFDGKGYYSGRLFLKVYKAHRIIYKMYYGVDPKYIDHINGIRNDNRIKNIRSVTQEENGKNQKLRDNNLSGTSGVRFNKKDNKWIAYINNKNIQEYIGSYEEKEDAIKARKEYEIKYEYHPNHGKQ